MSPKKIKGKIGRPLGYTDSLILLLMMLKIQFGLTYRSFQGFAESTLVNIIKVYVPDYTLVCKRAKALQHLLPKLSTKRPHTILLDASDLKIYGEGEWKRKIHGVGRPRKWLKLHISVDESTQEIVAFCLTESNVSDVHCAEKLVKKSGKRVRSVKADGAYDSKQFRNWVNSNGAKTLIPPPKNSRYKYTNPHISHSELPSKQIVL